MLLHNILPLRGRLASPGAVADGSCAHCGGGEDVSHFFQHCSCVSDVWDNLCVKLLAVVLGFPSDLDLSGVPRPGGGTGSVPPGDPSGCAMGVTSFDRPPKLTWLPL